MFSCTEVGNGARNLQIGEELRDIGNVEQVVVEGTAG